jgi:hypothetical protein
MPKTMTAAMDIAGDIAKTADDLRWCTRERYFADEGIILKGGNELVSLYSRPSADEAADVAAKLNDAIDPLRKRRVAELIAKLRALTDELENEDV